jgi:hypothetical protein
MRRSICCYFDFVGSGFSGLSGYEGRREGQSAAALHSRSRKSQTGSTKQGERLLCVCYMARGRMQVRIRDKSGLGLRPRFSYLRNQLHFKPQGQCGTVRCRRAGGAVTVRLQLAFRAVGREPGPQLPCSTNLLFIFYGAACCIRIYFQTTPRSKTTINR